MSGSRFVEQLASWKTPRPSYMREIEPLAHEDAWHSPGPMCTGTPDQVLNRNLFHAGRNRKESASAPLPSAERKTG